MYLSVVVPTKKYINQTIMSNNYKLFVDVWMLLVCPKCQFRIDRDLQSALNLEKKISVEYPNYKHREFVRPVQISFDLCGKFVEVLTKEIADVRICQ
jgi:hypothetical protein